MTVCPTCKNTPLDAQGRCVTCAAQADGMVVLDRKAFDVIRQELEQLAEAGLSPEMEEVPSADEPAMRRARPAVWNLYVPKDEAPRAQELLGKAWAQLLDEGAREAAVRGMGPIDLDAGGEITCPACGHTFPAQGNLTECPDCGLGLGVGDAAPEDEGRR
ncbi:MAG: hypothetical protein QM767_05715 [Anaeromyxobacter sp.]